MQQKAVESQRPVLKLLRECQTNLLKKSLALHYSSLHLCSSPTARDRVPSGHVIDQSAVRGHVATLRLNEVEVNTR